MEGESEQEVWSSNVTEVSLRVPLPADGSNGSQELSFSLRLPSWRKVKLPEKSFGRDEGRRKRFYKLKAEARRCYLQAQQKVAALALQGILEQLPEELLSSTRRTSASLQKAQEVLDKAKLLLEES